jgi:hypothetical protein
MPSQRYYNVFDSVVASAFQIIFRVKMHTNDFFYFLKIIFDISTSKRSKTYKSYLILVKKKKFQFFWERRRSRVPKRSLNLTLQTLTSFLFVFIF